MTTKLKYNGAGPIWGTTIVGKPDRWYPGQIQDVTDADATLYVAANVGFEVVGAVDQSSVFDGLTTSGLVATVPGFEVAGFSFAGGSIALTPSGTWFVGVEISSGQLRTLPRLGHSGWVPVARVVTSAVEVTELQQITPVLPTCRIPRTMAKVLAGKPISVVVMGSSLTASSGAPTDWPGMVFGAGTADKYKIPTVVSCQYTGVGGSPNQYQLAQLGYASFHNSYGFPDSGVNGAIDVKGVPNGRSNLLTGVDVVVLGCLANGGDYRLETIEPLVRKLRQAGVEVIVTTDNPQGPSTVYATMTAAGLYVDGPEVIRVAELYGVEIADTAAYVVDAHIRASGVGIYGDSIHMASGTPTGPNVVVPANGHEAWARAVRSVFSSRVAVTPGSSSAGPSANFQDGTVQGFQAYAAATIANVGGELVITKNTAGVSQWGANLPLGVSSLQTGDAVRVSGVARYSGGGIPVLGVAAGSWASVEQYQINGAFDFVLNVNRSAVSPTLLFFGTSDSAPNGSTVTIDNIQVTIILGNTTTAVDAAPGRPSESRPLPPIRVVTDFKTPADAFVILPKDERQLRLNQPTQGVLAAHPWGASSFARRWSSTVGSTQDLLILATGKVAMLSADAAVGLALIHYRDVADGACTLDIKINGGLSKSVTINAVPFANEWFASLYTPTQFNAPGPCSQGSIEITVTSGTLKVAAFVALTADVDFLLPEQISYVGPGWLPKEISRSGLPGRPTDTAEDFAVVRCTGRRLAWIISGNPGSKQVQTWSDREIAAANNYGGNYHVYQVGKHLGPGANHVIKCVQANAAGSQAEGHALHIGGAIVINDR